MDAVICGCAFCTFPGKETAAAEFARVLRPGGQVGITDVAVAEGGLPTELATLTSWVACLAAACSVGGFLCYNYGLRRLPSSLAVNILNMVPVFGVVGAVIIDGETVQAIQLADGVMTIAGVSIGMLKQADGPEIPRAADPVAVSPARRD